MQGADRAGGGGWEAARAAASPSCADRLQSDGIVRSAGNLLFTGIILRVEEGSIVLRNRSGVRQVIQLRQDTRYIGSGLPDMRQAMPMGRPVQVRAGKTFEGDVEAFTIMWGEILRVR